jgi:hypothetical protein
MRIDLHTHTTASDGGLSPAALLQRAKLHGLQILSITDHDTLSAYDSLPQPPITGIDIIPGIEFSTRWHKLEIHILGLNIDPDNPTLKAGIDHQQQSRTQRASHIAGKLEKLGMNDPLPEVKRLAGDGIIGRMHFARYMVSSGFVKDTATAFKKFLGSGKPANCIQHWLPMGDIIGWIRAAGGSIILAHPAKYGLTHTRLLQLIQDFQAEGGHGLEVVSGMQAPEVTKDLARICAQYQLLASCGSDFHQPDQPWSELGRFSPLPESCIPVWQHW